MQRAETTLSAFTHKLSQLLTTMRGHIELGLMNEQVSSACREVLSRALADADHMVWLIRAVRELSEADAPVPCEPNVYLDQIVQEVIHALRPVALSRGVQIELALDRNRPVRANRDRLQQAILMILSQAINRSPRGGTVSISSAQLLGVASLTITDQGGILSAREIESLFDPFHGGNLVPPGSGLEWALAKRFIEACEGSVAVECKGNRECSFQMRLLQELGDL